MRPKTIHVDEITITDVRAVPGDSAFLLDDGKTAVLCDTGFSFTCETVIQNIRQVIGERTLDYILLTHSHYDHVLGVPRLVEEYPDVRTVAGAYAAQVFERESAKATMCRLNEKSAEVLGMYPGEVDVNKLKVDIPVTDGERINCGTMAFTAIALPGHTKCSFGYYLAEKKLFLSMETLGVYFGKDTYLPSFLVGYQLTLDAFKKVKRLDIERILLPHYGMVEREQARTFLERSEAAAKETAQFIVTLFHQGRTKQEIFECLTERDYQPRVRPVYPFEAFRVNTQIMIELAVRELDAQKNEPV